MSRNYDLLMRLEADTDSANTVHSSPVRHPGSLLFKDGANERSDEVLRLIQRMFLSGGRNAPKQIVLFGVDEESGSSSICARVGRTLAANSSLPICLVDANLRSPRLSRLFGVDEKRAFAATSDPLREQCVMAANNLWLAGPNILADNSRVLLPLSEIKERLAQLRKMFEYLLIDAPGTSVSGDAQLLGQVADASILVIEANKTRRLSARNAKATLDAAGIRLLGTVLHNRSFPIPECLYRKL